MPRAGRMLGDPAGSVGGVRVLPHLFEAHDVGRELVEPRNDLVAPLGPPGSSNDPTLSRTTRKTPSDIATTVGTR